MRYGERCHLVEYRRDVVERAGPAFLGHAGPAVFGNRDDIAAPGEGVRQRASVSAVESRPPEPAVDEYDQRCRRDSGQTQVDDVLGQRAVHHRQVGRGSRLLQDAGHPVFDSTCA
jgi:hypothetical protein